MKIFIETLTKKIITLEVEQQNTIDNIKYKIFNKEGFPCNKQVLIFEGKQMQNDSTLKDHNIQDGQTLYLVISQWAGILVYVKDGDGYTTNIHIEQSDSIEKVKELIQEIGGYRADQQRLICKGKCLIDGKYVSDYDIKKESTIHLVMRLRGG